MKVYLGNEVIFHDYKGIIEGIAGDNYILVRTIEKGSSGYSGFTLSDIIRHNGGNIDNWKFNNDITHLRPLRNDCIYRWINTTDTCLTIRSVNIMETE